MNHHIEKEKKGKKTYEFNGVMRYAHCFLFYIEANNKKEAKKMALEEVKRHIDPPMAEFQDYIIDEPIIQKHHE